MGARDQTGLFVTHRVVLGWLIALVACKPTTAERHTASRRGTGFDTSLNAFDTSLNACTTSPRSQRYVVLSADTNDMAYAAFLPLTTYVWAQKHGVKPIVVLVAQTPVSAQADYVATWVVRAGGLVRFVTPGDGGDSRTMSQVVRLAAFSLGVARGNDVLITADADIWPLSSSYWKRLLDTEDDVMIANGDFFWQQRGTTNRIAISYVAAKACLWKRIVTHGLSQDAATADATGWNSWARNARRALGARPPRGATSRVAGCVASAILERGATRFGSRWHNDALEKERSVRWSWDQVFLTKSVLSLNETARLRTTFGRGLSAGRLDRIGWTFGGDAEAHTDAHLPHVDIAGGEWGPVLSLWEAMFPGRAGWAEDYAKQFPT
jgi:hypothetical protein